MLLSTSIIYQITIYTLLSSPLDYIKLLGVYTRGLVILAYYKDTLKELCFEVMPLVATEAHYKKQFILNLFCEILGDLIHYITYCLRYKVSEIHAFY